MFDRDAHLAMYATLLEALKAHLGERWYRLGDPACNDPLIAEMRRTGARLIREASESCDHRATVDFITENAAAEIERRIAEHPTATARKSHLDSLGVLGHEHMCPNKQVLACLTQRELDYPIAQVLGMLSFRALVSTRGASSDLAKLERKADFKSRIPNAEALRQLYGRDVAVPLQFYPLLRYHAAGLLKDLIPRSERAKQLMAAYCQFVG